MTTKVITTEKYNDSQGEHIVTRGILKCIPIPIERASKFSKSIEWIIISNEPIEVGDKGYCKKYGIQNLDTKLVVDAFIKEEEDAKKIIALPEHFSPKHLQAIVDEKLQDGDEVLVECDYIDAVRVALLGEHEAEYKITLNQSSHIKLFRVDKEATWEEIKTLIKSKVFRKNDMLNAAIEGSINGVFNILEREFNPPTRK